MKTELSRDSYRRGNRYSGVYQQQGRMITDADWNELMEIVKNRLDDVMRDIVGAGAPRNRRVDPHDPPAKRGVRIVAGPAGEYRIQGTHLYAGGVVATVAPDADDAVDLALAPNLRSFTLGRQADLPVPQGATVPAPGTADLRIYADVWERPLTYLEDPGVRDPALHGADTATRTRTMGQIKWGPNSIDPADPARNPRIGDARLTLKLHARSTDPDPCDPCADQVAVDQRIGNYLFRVEVHDVTRAGNGTVTGLTLKWSSENGAEQYEYGVPEVPLDFYVGDLAYELYDLACESHLGVFHDPGFPPARGTLHPNRVALDTAGALPKTTTRYVRRWDGYVHLQRAGNAAWPTASVDGWDKGLVLNGAGGRTGFDVGAGVAFTAALARINLRLELNDGSVDRRFVAGDYWQAPVRENHHAVGAELLDDLPRGIVHHYLLLAETNAQGALIDWQTQDDARWRQLNFPQLSDLWAADVGYATVCPSGLFDATHDTVKKALDRLCEIGAGHVGYTTDCPSGLFDATHDTVKKALDRLCRIDAKHIGYSLPACPDPGGGRQTVQSLFAQTVGTWPDLDTDGRTTLHDMIWALLCQLAAKTVPYDPTPKLSLWTESGSAPLTHAWSKNFDPKRGAEGWGIDVDRQGNVIHIASVELRPGKWEAVVVKRDPDGVGLSHHSLGWPNAGGNLGIAVIRSAATGGGRGVIFGNRPAGGGVGDLFVLGPDRLARLSGTDLSVTWEHALGTTSGSLSATATHGVAADSDGNMLVIGSFSGRVDFGGGITLDKTNPSLFVAKFSGRNGAAIWARSMGASGSIGGMGLASDGEGNPTISGAFSGKLLGPADEPLAESKGSFDIFVARLDGRTGDLLWSRALGASFLDIATAVAVDGQDNTLVTGAVQRETGLPGGTGSSPGSIDLFAAKVNPKGQVVWETHFGPILHGAIGWAVAADPDDNVLLTGAFQGTLAIGRNTLTSDPQGGSDLFLAKLDPNGTPIAARAFSGPLLDVGLGIVADHAGSIFLAGQFQGKLDLSGAGAILKSHGKGPDTFIAQFAGQPLPFTVQQAIDQLVSRIKPQVGVPVGTVAPYAAEAPPPGWLECDGQTVSRTEYADLFQVIGTRFGMGNGATSFNVPDLRGRFVRGWDHGGGIDPDAATRAPIAPGGQSGDRVGTYQADALQKHIHSFVGNSGTTNTDTHNHTLGPKRDLNIFGAYWAFSHHKVDGTTPSESTGSDTHSHTFKPTGTISNPSTGTKVSEETRGKNVALMHIIKF